MITLELVKMLAGNRLSFAGLMSRQVKELPVW